jgi:type I restriction enzyme S subunit
LQKSAAQLIPGNSIAIVTRVGVGKLAFMPVSYTTSQDFLSLSELNIDEIFGCYSIYKMLQKEKGTTQGTSIKGITKDEVLNKKISVPNMDEQKKIGKYFSSLDYLITLHQRKCEETKMLKKFMLQKMFPQDGACVPEIRFSGFTDDWEQRKLSEYIVVSTEKNRDNTYGKEDVLSVSGDYGIVNQIQFQGRSFAGVSVANYGVVNTGDIVYTKSPLSSNPFGIIKTNKEKTGIVSTLYAVYHPTEKVNSDFIQVYFEQNARMNNYMQPLVNKGAKNDMKVSAENALKGAVIFPQKAEQDAVVAYFSILDHLITLHQHKCEELQNIKKFMLQNMFV